MSLLLDGTNGLSDVDGTAATPAIRGTDANTGIFFPAADTIAFSEGGVESMRIDSAGNVGIGTASPNYKLSFGAPANGTKSVAIYESGGGAFYGFGNDVNRMVFYTGNTGGGAERMAVDSSGNLLVGTTSSSGKLTVQGAGDTLFTRNTAASGFALVARTDFTSSNGNLVALLSASGIVGTITTNNSSTAYNTTSDYRLKENVVPMTGALEKIAALKPCTYKWKATGEVAQGFIAHELQAVVPDCVTGEKDAVETVDDLDAEGRKIGTKEVPRYQGVDTSFLVATLVAAIQELKAEFDAYKATHP
jgi:hypothetical protein